jgi:hypothetical protein
MSDMYELQMWIARYFVLAKLRIVRYIQGRTLGRGVFFETVSKVGLDFLL